MSKPITDHELTSLRARLNDTIELALHGSEHARRACAGRLHAQLVDWEQEVKGGTTINTLTNDQIEALRARMPWRCIIIDAALAGNVKARAWCVECLAQEEEAAAHGQILF